MARNANLKWEVPAWAASPGASDSNLFFTLLAPNLTSQDTLTIIDSQEIEAHDKEQLTLIRLVGCIRMCTQSAAGAGGSLASVKVRLHKGMEVNFDGLPVVSYADPWNPDDAEEEFLWERQYDVAGVNQATNFVDWECIRGVGVSPPNRGDSPYWSEIDIKLKRTLRPPEVLGLTFGVKGLAGDSLRVWAWLRALVAI